jgi:hypothetical protein
MNGATSVGEGDCSPRRHLKILPTKANLSKPWLVAMGFTVWRTTAAGNPVRGFRSETIISEHGTVQEARRAVRGGPSANCRADTPFARQSGHNNRGSK